MTFSPVIGLEIHAQLATKTKLFCRCENTSDDLERSPNSAVCPTCLGLPGALPVLNRVAVEWTIALGQSLASTIAPVTKWDRKNYFYPDLPKGYQISQYDQPLCRGGTLTLPDGSSVALTRIHLEEDTGKLTHVGKTSLIDFNRSSIPLLELVTEPMIDSARHARQFCEEYQHHLRDLGIAHASMEKGQMRCEANVSVIRDGADRLSGTKVEIKNLNSFRSLERAIDFEIARQSKMLASGEKIVQETRGWNEAKGETYPMRKKETSDDYRYFPEPDLWPLQTAGLNVARRDASRTNLRDELITSGVNKELTDTVVNHTERRAAFIAWQAKGLPKQSWPRAVQWLAQLPDLRRFAPDEIVGALTDSQFDPDTFYQAASAAKPGQLLGLISEIRLERNQHDIPRAVAEFLAANDNVRQRLEQGDDKLVGFVIGQVKRQLGPSANSQAIRDEVIKQIGSRP